jgi:hypothetical protein
MLRRRKLAIEKYRSAPNYLSDRYALEAYSYLTPRHWGHGCCLLQFPCKHDPTDTELARRHGERGAPSSVSRMPEKATVYRHCKYQRHPLDFVPTQLQSHIEMNNATSQLHASQGMSKAVTGWLDSFKQRKSRCQFSCPAPSTSRSRLLESLADRPLDLSELEQQTRQDQPGVKDTVLYLAYGSNLSAETFRGKRGIRPISQVNVLVPELVVTFDLPGVPYSEPCFANTRYRQRDPVAQTESSEKDKLLLQPSDYHKDRWHKGLVGVVYEVTKRDYAHIIATEGGGAGYQDVVVDCYTLSGDPTEEVPLYPKGEAFKAHTLFSPPRVIRPDPSYAQPSARYLKLITDGAQECSLPYEYQTYLRAIRPYEPTTTRQRLGQFVFLSTWAPAFALIFGAGNIFLDKNGRYPEWYKAFANAIFVAVWASYDHFFKDLFGDGERTMGEDERSVSDEETLLGFHRKEQSYGAVKMAVHQERLTHLNRDSI